MSEKDQYVSGEGSRFDLRVIKVVRGREARTKAKMQNQGWELVSVSTGTLRTELTFRRPRRKSPLVYLAAGWATFRTLPPKAQAGIALAAGVAVVTLIVAVAVSSDGGPDASPAAGIPVSSATASSSRTSAATSSEPTGSTVPPTDSTTSQSTSTGGDRVITVKNNRDFAALAREGDYCGDAIQAFATKYWGRTVEFDGSIAAMNNYGSYKTRHDILVSMGPKGAEARGPAFQFNNVDMYALHLTGNVPETIGVDDQLHVIARLRDFMPQHGCLYMLDPISTEVR